MNAKQSHHLKEKGSFEVKVGLAEMLKGGVIMEVLTPEQAVIAEDAGAVAVMALEKTDSEMCFDRGVARMPNPDLILKIQEAVSIPVMAKCRIGHFAEAQILEALFIDFIDESPLLTPADEDNHIYKHSFKIPFICSYTTLSEALQRISEGAAMVCTQGDKSGENISKAVKQLRDLYNDINRLRGLDLSELMAESQKLHAPFELVKSLSEKGRLPVPNFASGGISTPADAALMMQLGADSLFVSPRIFHTEDPIRAAAGIVSAVRYYNDPEMLSKISCGHLSPIPDDLSSELKKEEIFNERDWN